MFDLRGKTALVTGASGGIGWAVAKVLALRGVGVGLSGVERPCLGLWLGRSSLQEVGRRRRPCGWRSISIRRHRARRSISRVFSLRSTVCREEDGGREDV